MGRWSAAPASIPAASPKLCRPPLKSNYPIADSSKHTGHRERGSRIPLRNFKTSTEFLGPNRTGFLDRYEVVAAAAIADKGLLILHRKLTGQLPSHFFIHK